MIINNIKLNNIGPYIDDNSFEFNHEDKGKRIVLIGGKNGAGKTTFFNAIKACLYGCIAYGFESNNTRYYEIIRKLINANELLNKNGYASIEIDITFDDGMYNNEYLFKRSWVIKGKRIVEQFELYKNDDLLSETEKSDFESFFLHIIPPNLFKFYFFDGEKISDFIFNNNKNSDFKDAFLKLCNLDTMEIICEHFKRVSKSKSNNGRDIFKSYNDCLKEDTIISQRIDYAEEEYQNINNEIDSLDDQLATLNKKYAKRGGISKKEWRAMEEQISKEEARRDENRKWLKDVANNVLPFIVLRQQLNDLRDQIKIEHKAQVDANVKSTIDTPEIKTIISGVLDNVGIELSQDIAKKIVFEISRYSSKTSQIVPILNLSEYDQFELTSKINSLLAFDTGRIKTATEDIKASLNCVKRIRKKMERSSVDNYDDYLLEKNCLNEKKIELTQRLLELDKELQSYKEQKSLSTAKLLKAKTEYEAILKKQSINDISARSLLAFEELQRILYEKNINLVEAEFERSFNTLINKSDLIDGIHIDENLNVLPYKNKEFELSELMKMINQNGEEYLIAQIGLYAYEVFRSKKCNDEKAIVLPVEIKQQLSAGEKQIFIMSLYQALTKLNKMNIPYIIDTPFSRIDKEHREKILEQFFKKLNGQIIILSTDEEIVGKYYKMTKDKVSNTFLLVHSSEGNTKIFKDVYFGDVIK